MTRKKESGDNVSKITPSGGAGSKGITKPKDRAKEVANRLEKFAWASESERQQPEKKDLNMTTNSEQEGPMEHQEVPETLGPYNGPVSNIPTNKESAPDLPPLQTAPTLVDIFAAVQTTNTSLNNLSEQLQNMRTDIMFIRQDLQNMRERMVGLEERLSGMEDEFVMFKTKCNTTSQKATNNATYLEDLENRFRRNNIRVVGLPEKIEGQNAAEFMENWLMGIVGKDNVSRMFAVERAHRVPARPPLVGGPPRPFIVRLLNYRDRELILRRARELGNIDYNGARVMMFPDFSKTIQQQRVKFQEVKAKLRQLQWKYSMLYPAKLRVVTEDTTVFFDSPLAAMTWLEGKTQNR